jgi:fructosamine-3-kinase
LTSLPGALRGDDRRTRSGRPVDIAYALWTGTVGDAFLDRYRARRGLDDGFEDRRAVYAVHSLDALGY